MEVKLQLQVTAQRGRGLHQADGSQAEIPAKLQKPDFKRTGLL